LNPQWAPKLLLVKQFFELAESLQGICDNHLQSRKGLISDRPSDCQIYVTREFLGRPDHSSRKQETDGPD